MQARGSSAIALTFLSVVLLPSAQLAAQTIWYVDADRPDGGNGWTWETAFDTLHDALDVALVGDEIRVAQGGYRPSLTAQVKARDATIPPEYAIGGREPWPPEPPEPPEPRKAAFQLIDGIAIYGGYAGHGEPDPDARDVAAFKTILSGDIGAIGDNADNCYHVVIGSGTDETAILDGFAITDGNANLLSWPHYMGGGILVDAGDPTISRCIFRANAARMYGAGMHNTHQSSPTVIACVFEDNVSLSHGGGMNNWHSSYPVVVGCTFRANRAVYGGGMQNSDHSHPTLANCIFVSNTATYSGAIDNVQSSPLLINCTFAENSAEVFGGAIYSERDSYPSLSNCILWSNIDSGGSDETAQIHNDDIYGQSGSEVDHCCVQGWTGALDPDGVGNIGDYPRFVAGYYLAQCPAGEPNDSPCVDAGDPVSDLIEGTTRTDGVLDSGIVDMGFHFSGPPCIGDMNSDTVRNVTDITLFAAAFGSTHNDPQFDPYADLNGDGVVNITDFTIFASVYGVPCP